MLRRELWIKFGERILVLEGGALLMMWTFSELALKQLSELQPAPSVGLHEVPRESVGQHLGFSVDEEAKDELDERLARKRTVVFYEAPRDPFLFPERMRFVYNLQRSQSSDPSDLDSSGEDSDDSIGRRRHHYNKPHKKRMSLLTGQYYEIPAHDQAYGHYNYCGPRKSLRRHYFRSAARWDPESRKALIGGPGLPNTAVPQLKVSSPVDKVEAEDENMEIEDGGDDDAMEYGGDSPVEDDNEEDDWDGQKNPHSTHPYNRRI
jgi:histone deacetylase 1/2